MSIGWLASTVVVCDWHADGIASLRLASAPICQLIFAILHRNFSPPIFMCALFTPNRFDDFTGGFSRQFNFSNCTFESEENEKKTQRK